MARAKSKKNEKKYRRLEGTVTSLKKRKKKHRQSSSARCFCVLSSLQGTNQYLKRKLVGSRPSKAKPSSSGLLKTEVAAVVIVAAPAVAVATVEVEVDCMPRCVFLGDAGRAPCASCRVVRPKKRCMKVYMWTTEKQEGGVGAARRRRRARKEEEGANEVCVT